MKILVTFFTKRSYLNEEVSCTEPSLSVSIPRINSFIEFFGKNSVTTLIRETTKAEPLVERENERKRWGTRERHTYRERLERQRCIKREREK